MKEFTVLTINPGSSSTKCGLVRGNTILLDKTVDHSRKDFESCSTFADQKPIRVRLIKEAIREAGVNLSKVDAVVGRGVGLYACEGGTYLIDDLVLDHAARDITDLQHPATLGVQIAKELADELNVPAFFVNPMPVDELCDEARMTGVKGLYRAAKSHPLNQKQVGIRHSELMGTKYEESNYIILHMGGGINITAHKQGRMIDSSRAGDAQGAICPNRSGDLCVDDVATLLKKGYTFEECYQLASNRGGLLDLLGTDDVREVKKMIAKGNKYAELCYNAMAYTIVKWTAMMAGALSGKVDGILLTGGMAYDEDLVQKIRDGAEWIAPVYVYPGSFETEAMASGAVRVLSGQEKAKKYSGRPVWDESMLPV